MSASIPHTTPNLSTRPHLWCRYSSAECIHQATTSSIARWTLCAPSSSALTLGRRAVHVPNRLNPARDTPSLVGSGDSSGAATMRATSMASTTAVGFRESWITAKSSYGPPPG